MRQHMQTSAWPSLFSSAPNEAIDSFQRATAAGLQTAEIYDNLGIALTRTGREDEAIAAAEIRFSSIPRTG